MPQLIGTTVDALWGEPDEKDAAGGLGLTGVGEGGGGSGSGTGYGRLGGSSSARTESSDLLKVGNLADITRASGVEAGALFVYAIPQPVDLGARDSALVPFVSQPVDARPIVWSRQRRVGRPERGTLRQLDGADASRRPHRVLLGRRILRASRMLARPGPGERRFVTCGADLDVELTTKQSKSAEEPKRLVFDKATHTLAEHAIRVPRTSPTRSGGEPERPHARRLPGDAAEEQRDARRAGGGRLRHREQHPARRR